MKKTKPMPEPPKSGEIKILSRALTQELKESYLDYAMSVIVARALPDVRDGLKPVQRRILWAMWDNALKSTAKFKKSANVVGEVLGKYHPHGDMAVYDALARMAQDFSLRYPLIDGQGNWGSIDGDSPAAMRYTEARLAKISDALLTDIEKETIDWQPNYDNSRQEPKVLPAELPNLLINGAMGIAVGMATSIPPHNLREVAEAAIYLTDHPQATVKELMEYVPAPDFPTGGVIYDKKALEEAYTTGKGSVVTRAAAEITENKKGDVQIVITEIPYQVNKSELIVKMAELVQEKKIEGIRDLRDESDREGLRIVVEMKNGASAQKILNQLYQYTNLQKSFHINMLALAEGIQPQIMSLKEILQYYIEHRQNVIRRRTEFDLRKAEDRCHILEGLVKALDIIDKIISVIKKSKDRQTAHENLVKTFKFTPRQADAILEMKLQSLAALERIKLEAELKEKRKLIAELKDILKNPKKILALIKDDLSRLKESFGEERRTKVVAGGLKEFKEEDLIPQEETIITLTQAGYIKRMPPLTFKAQRRGGKGLIGFELKEEDVITQFISADTHDNILFFTDRGRVFQTKVYEIPPALRTSKGKFVQNFLDIPTDEQISTILAYSAKTNPEKMFLAMVTKNGLIKKTALSEFANVRRNGIWAIKLVKDDQLAWVKAVSGQDQTIITSALGQAIRFKEKEIRPMSRNAAGIRAIRLKKGDRVAGLDIIKEGEKELKLLNVMANGFGKQTHLKEYKIQKRGGSGIRTAKITAKTGPIIGAHVISQNNEEILAFSAKGQALRTALKDIRIAGRAAQGVRIMNLDKDDKLMGIVCL